MAWWLDLDKEIYVALDDVKSRAGAFAGGFAAGWPTELSKRISGPTAILARHVATPNYETLWFARLARRHGFQAIVIEHRSDRFTAHNPAKNTLARLPIVTGRSRNGRPIIRRHVLFDVREHEGRPFDEIVTDSGEPLVAYHHRKLAEVMGADAPGIMDLRQILPRPMSDPFLYYREFFKMLYGHLVLLEDFVADEQTAAFFQKTVLPAWREAVADTGQRPQIARIVPGRRTSSPMLLAYPAAMADDVAWIRRPRRPREHARPAE